MTTSVEAIVTKMIYNWPTLFVSRADVLQHIFTGFMGAWHKDGYPEPDCDVRDLTPPDVTEYEEKFKNPDTKSSAAHIIVTKLKKAHDANFVRENAKYLANDRDIGFSSVPAFHHHYLKTIPVYNLNDEWTDAFEEYCRSVLLFDEKQARAMSFRLLPDYLNGVLADLKVSKETAKEGLVKLGLIDDSELQSRKKAIASLQKEAEKYGMKLTARE